MEPVVMAGSIFFLNQIPLTDDLVHPCIILRIPFTLFRVAQDNNSLLAGEKWKLAWPLGQETLHELGVEVAGAEVFVGKDLLMKLD